ncbi:MAG: hypothetical protein AAF658_06870 [Myxococcota bacterium]
MKLTRLSPVLMTAVAFVGCGSDDLTEEESQQAFAAALSVGTLGSAQAGGAVTEVDGGFSFTCPAGGSATFTGTFDDSASQEQFDWSITYNSCDTGGLVIDGQITYTAQLTEHANSSTATFSMRGSLEFSGDIDGDCELNVNWTAASSGDDVSFEYNGSICGFDASVANTTNISF